MSIDNDFSHLSSAEQAALLYVVGSWTQKELFARHGVSYSEFKQARKELIEQGILETEKTASQRGYSLIPTEAWIEIRSSLRNQLERSGENNLTISSEKFQLKKNIDASNEQIETLYKKLSDLNESLEKNRELAEILGSFAAMKINVQWVRSIVALTLIEAAMKKKLELLGLTVKPNTSFGDLRTALEQQIKEKEKRELRPRLLGLNELSSMRNKIVHTGHLFVQLPKSEADALVENISDLIAEILAFS